MSLLSDEPRCPGHECDDGSMREGCDDCQRRTDRSTFPLDHWMAPPEIVVFECEWRIPPEVK